MELIERLSSKAKAGVSNPACVTPELLEAAIVEANELIENKSVSDTVKLDIAYFRLMLMIKKTGIDDLELDIYNNALRIVKNAPIINNGIEEQVSPVMVCRRKNKWQ